MSSFSGFDCGANNEWCDAADVGIRNAAMAILKRSLEFAAVPASSLGMNGIALLVMLCGALSPIKLGLVGDIYAPELALPLVALIARSSAQGSRGIREPLFATLLMAGMVTLIGYALSDLIQGSRVDQLMRGWGRVGLVISDFICLAVIFGQDRRNLWWYFLGAGLGSILFLRLVSHAPLGLWKFGYADPVVQACAALGAFVPMQITSIGIGLLGIYSMWTDFRSFAAICLAVAALIWLRIGNRGKSKAASANLIKLLLAGAAVLVVVTLSATGGSDSGRRNESDAGRRAAFETGVEAVMRSPFIGYGSWAESPELAAMYRNRANQLRGGKGAGGASKREVIFNPHSQILHAWFEGGLLGTAFLAVVLVQLLRQGGWLLGQRPLDVLTPILLYVAMMTAWNLFMSPFSAPHRLGIAMGAAVLVMLRIEQRQGAAQTDAIPVSRPLANVATRPLDAPVPSGRKLRYARRRVNWKYSVASGVGALRTRVDGPYGSS
jgi:O-antigen ligase